MKNLVLKVLLSISLLMIVFIVSGCDLTEPYVMNDTAKANKVINSLDSSIEESFDGFHKGIQKFDDSFNDQLESINNR